ncbi:hypothetical protein JZO70_08625 [Enterococcus sp. 669A]|uniref:GyrI-like small molecule binding domain-containing protein n=1 Tax=Candidatus Enterococcus moelleringii TaxID=2815325 RepID=A0ABS3L9C0_9ENTE|nr:hypothetical protein [Enterococcus sp. 669A]MBO1306221.1 hypothetical protein [Enterococcus sp. 669A]
MTHCINLNIHYTIPDELWDKVLAVFRSMPYWTESSEGTHWFGPDIDLSTSVEPGGIQIYGTMPDEIWTEWYSSLKEKLTNALGYEIGEPEDGYEFKYWDTRENTLRKILRKFLRFGD